MISQQKVHNYSNFFEMPLKIKLLGVLFFLYSVFSLVFNLFMIKTPWGEIDLGKSAVGCVIFIFGFVILRTHKIHIHSYFILDIIFFLYCIIQCFFIPESHRPDALVGIANLFVSFFAFACIYDLVVHFSLFQYFLNCYLFGCFASGIFYLLNNSEGLLNGNRFNKVVNKQTVSYFLGAPLEMSATAIGMWMSIAFALTLYLYYKRDTKKALLFGFYFLIIVLLSGSRKNLVFIVIITLIIFIMRNRANWAVKIIPFIGMLFIVFSFTMRIPLIYEIFGSRLDAAVDITLGKKAIQADHSMNDRVWLIEQAKYYWRKSPIIGQGINAFKAHLLRIRNVNPHNNFWDILCSTGLVGFVLYYTRYMYLLSKTINLYLKGKEKYADALFFTGLIIAMLSIEWWQGTYFDRNSTIIFLFVILYLENQCQQVK